MKINKAFLFVGLTFIFSWLLAAVFFLSGGKYNSVSAVIMAVVYMFVPSIVVFILQKGIFKEGIKEPLGVYFKFNRWFFIGWFLPLAAAFLALGVSLLLPWIKYSPDMAGFFERLSSTVPLEQIQKAKEQIPNLPATILLITAVQSLIFGITINAVAGFGEELGWRGFLQKELIPIGFWRSSLFIGLIWGIWHAPLILNGHNYPQHPFIGVFMMIAWCVLLAPIFSFIRLKSGSVITAAIMHGTLNASAGIAIVVISGGNDLNTGMTGLPGFIALAVINVIIFLFGRTKELKY